jgi:hypothetical protein
MTALRIIAGAAVIIAAVQVKGLVQRSSKNASFTLLDAELLDDVAERRAAAEGLGLNPQARERLLRRFYGAGPWRVIQAAEARRAPLGSEGGPSDPRSRQGQRHD